MIGAIVMRDAKVLIVKDNTNGNITIGIESVIAASAIIYSNKKLKMQSQAA